MFMTFNVQKIIQLEGIREIKFKAINTPLDRYAHNFIKFVLIMFQLIFGFHLHQANVTANYRFGKNLF